MILGCLGQFCINSEVFWSLNTHALRFPTPLSRTPNIATLAIPKVLSIIARGRPKVPTELFLASLRRKESHGRTPTRVPMWICYRTSRQVGTIKRESSTEASQWELEKRLLDNGQHGPGQHLRGGAKVVHRERAVAGRNPQVGRETE